MLPAYGRIGYYPPTGVSELKVGVIVSHLFGCVKYVANIVFAGFRAGVIFVSGCAALPPRTGITAIAAWRNVVLDRQSKASADNFKVSADNLRLSEKRLFSEQFATAEELMAKENKDGKPAISTRSSGIHMMEKLAKSAPEEFAEQVVKNLIAYIKGHAQLTATPPLKDGETPTIVRMLGEDVKTAFASLHNILSDDAIKAKIDDTILNFSEQDFSWLVLSRAHANLSHYKEWRGAKLQSSFLGGVNLKGANLLVAQLHSAGLSAADLTEANLTFADMTATDLLGANLHGAKLRGTKLLGAELTQANLSYADMKGALLRDANMDGANLYKTNGADLREVKNAEAIVDEKLD